MLIEIYTEHFVEYVHTNKNNNGLEDPFFRRLKLIT